MPTIFTQEADFRKEREFGQKISATFEFIGAHWRPLGRVMLYTVVPAALLQGVVNSVVQLRVFGTLVQPGGTGVAGAQAQLARMSALTGSPLYWLNIVLSLALFTLVVLTIYGYLLGCLRGPGSGGNGGNSSSDLSAYLGQPDPAEVSPAQVWSVIRREFVGSFFSFFGIYLLLMVGFLFLVIPGIYLLVMLSLFFVVKVVEGTGFGDTVSRCWHLIKGKWWSTAGLMFVMLLLLYALLVLPTLLAGLLGGGITTLLRTGLFQSPVFVVVLNALNTGLLILFYPPLLLVLAFQYFNLVERREGVGLRGLVGQLGQAGPAARNASYQATEEGEY